MSIRVEDQMKFFDSLRGSELNIPVVRDEQYRSFLTGVFSSLCHKVGIRIIRSECFEQDGHLALIMHADATESSVELDILRQLLETAGDKLSATVRVQKEELFRYMHRI